MDVQDIAATLETLDLSRHAFFFDFDGTLAEFSADPADTVLDPRLAHDLLRLSARTGGAVAIITGRGRHEIIGRVGDAIPVAGLHGTDFPDGARPDPADITRRKAAVRPLLADLQALADAHPGAVLEDKGQGLALHWRAAPEAEAPMIKAIARTHAALGPDWQIQPGKFVAELRPSGGNKGTALRRFMRMPPFAGRRPVAFGDDLNDTPMLFAARELGGIAVALGEREMQADHRLSGPRALAQWLERRLA
ncbi:MAG: trehalose-phosphatase [Paracoccus sp. (in: a-proteobacteria)]|uniref:trehalose-phosphatase n=1 Tax=Paracoccus sp. TaxID=267 RepID=UPI0039E2AAAF